MDEERHSFGGADCDSEDCVDRLFSARGNKVNERSRERGGLGLSALAVWIEGSTKALPDAVHIAIRVSHGSVFESVLERDSHVYAINLHNLILSRPLFTGGGKRRL